MSQLKKIHLSFFLLPVILFSCSKDENATAREPMLNFIYKFDSNQIRLNALGLPAPVDAANAAQSPKFNSMSSHYVELSKDQFTALGAGAVVYRAPEVTTGGASAIDFSKSSSAANGEIFLSVPLKTISPGTYNWLRVSLAYQNYTVVVNASGQALSATIASFIGFRTYISRFKVKDSTLVVNANKNQGFWAFETASGPFGILSTGQAPQGATTVPNPLFASSPIPQGSCVVTGQFGTGLLISGNESTDINIVVSLSTNKSFEWKNNDGNNTFDPLNGDEVVDMGIRGLIPIRQ